MIGIKCFACLNKACRVCRCAKTFLYYFLYLVPYYIETADIFTEYFNKSLQTLVFCHFMLKCLQAWNNLKGIKRKTNFLLSLFSCVKMIDLSIGDKKLFSIMCLLPPLPHFPWAIIAGMSERPMITTGLGHKGKSISARGVWCCVWAHWCICCCCCCFFLLCANTCLTTQ